ncbi:PRD domain-containing protein [Sesbania bispinosa]|nr:PRD domain-containing protein [Sesbania bispinosa]
MEMWGVAVRRRWSEDRALVGPEKVRGDARCSEKMLAHCLEEMLVVRTKHWSRLLVVQTKRVRDGGGEDEEGTRQREGRRIKLNEGFR